MRLRAPVYLPIILTLASATMANAQNPAAAIQRITEKLARAYEARDIGMVEPYLTEDFYFESPDGGRTEKRAYIAGLSSDFANLQRQTVKANSVLRSSSPSSAETITTKLLHRWYVVRGKSQEFTERETVHQWWTRKSGGWKISHSRMLTRDNLSRDGRWVSALYYDPRVDAKPGGGPGVPPTEALKKIILDTEIAFCNRDLKGSTKYLSPSFYGIQATGERYSLKELMANDAKIFGETDVITSGFDYVIESWTKTSAELSTSGRLYGHLANKTTHDQFAFREKAREWWSLTSTGWKLDHSQSTSLEFLDESRHWRPVPKHK